MTTFLLCLFAAKKSIPPISLSEMHLPPSFSHPFGTDALGRDLFILCVKGLGTSIFIGLMAALFDLFIGIPYGCLAGYIQGRTGTAMMRLVDILYVIPMVLQVLLFISIFGSGLLPVILSFSFSSWTAMSRVVFSQVKILSQKPFVLYAAWLGASYPHLFFTHLLKNLWPFILPVLMYTVPKAIFIEAFLSFLGLGISPPHSSLGTLIAEGMSRMEFFPWQLYFPSGLLLISLFSFQQCSHLLKQDRSQ
ncbi:MAG: ABC transporter permease [Chlamydiota bacterium]